LFKLVQLQQNSTPQPNSQKPARTAGESHGCKRTRRVLAVNVERATSATRGPLPSAALSAGCRQDDLRWDLKHGFLALHKTALDSPIVAPGPLASDAGGVVYEEWRHARLVLLQKKGAVRFAKIGVAFVFLSSVRSCCRLYLCVACIYSLNSLACTHKLASARTAVLSMAFLLRLSDFTRNVGLRRGHSLLTW
jgi:hypothetical protein